MIFSLDLDKKPVGGRQRSSLSTGCFLGVGAPNHDDPTTFHNPKPVRVPVMSRRAYIYHIICNSSMCFGPKFVALSWLLLLAYYLRRHCRSSPPLPPPLRVWTHACKWRDPIQLDWTSKTSRRNINLPMNQKGYDTFKITVGKLLARRIQIFLIYSCKSHFDLFFQNNF